ncbi:MAG: 23S rRNA (pseudouridine(1915)-N(3))-methyltransferase RlmH [Candidatus Coatesbacteria bacterium]|nr:23S rRNA (pseudouridine(1915)-N(3))-methyltransferase RlmH [Candidatus Coatesbacteria bacterium]
MFAVRLITVDPTRRDFIRRGVGFYLQRLQRFCDFELLELRSPPVREGAKGAVAAARRHAAEAVADKLKAEHQLVQLDPRGKVLSSEAFAARLDDWRLTRTGLDLALGGAHGLEPLPGAFRLSLGPWTLPHELARLVVVEGLYRAFTILSGHPYHKG